jgi:hypothetical protein
MLQEHYTEPEEVYLSRVALHRKQSSQKFILTSDGEEGKTSSQFMSTSKMGLPSCSNQAAKGTKSR